MNLDELRPLWKSYQDQVGEQYHWNEGELSELLREKTIHVPWYKLSQRSLLNLCVSMLLLGITGC
jgi:hypothetical protein